MVDDKKYEPDIFKKFWKTKTSGGFVAVRPWFEAGKLSVDIGETSAGGGLVGNTLVWTPVFPFATYLKAIANNTAKSLYTNSQDSPETFMYYGGSKTDIGPVSRILKVSYWPNDTSGSAFQFKTGHFKAKESSTGAFLPDMKSPISTHSVKVTRTEIAEMSYIVDLSVVAFTAKENWLSHLSGKERS